MRKGQGKKSAYETTTHLPLRRAGVNMKHGILKRLVGDAVVESRIYEGVKDRKRFLEIWLSFADTTAVQVEPRGPQETRFKGRYRDGSIDRRVKRGPRKVSLYKHKLANKIRPVRE